ncbi:MAG: hypothetical protein KGR26_11735, partial [Cyanobacteria bacterium REEB65]|nr:hypothetical protein [Cyanobacteria bacterium REEB65]
TVTITSLFNGALNTPYYSNNPANVGVAQGYCGTNATATAGYISLLFEAVYEWYDGAGQLHQSAPSAPTTVWVPTYVTDPGGVSIAPNAVFTVGVQNLFLTQKELNGSKVGIAIYQTQSNQPAVFYRITNPLSPLLNQATSLASTTFTANQPDSSAQAITGLKPTTGLASNQPLYTTGGKFGNDTPLAASILCNHQDRIFLAGLEQSNVIAFSKEFSSGNGLGFSFAQTITLNATVGTASCGPITGLESMDSSLIIFQQNAVQVVSGEGPDDAGNGTPFSLPQLVASSTAVGCRDPGSIALTPNGLIFKSQAGWYLLDRTLQLRPIGKKVQAYNADVCTSARAVPNSTQVRCLCGSSGTSLLYDWYYDSWAPLGSHSGWDACILPSGLYTYANASTGVVQTEAPGTYGDAVTGGYPMTIQTSWLKLSSIQGFGAIWWIYLKGLFLGTQAYQVQVAYNYNQTVVDTLVYQPLAGTNPGGADPWGSPATWGADYWGVPGGVVAYANTLQFRINPSQKHLESIQLTITELPPYS